MKKFIGLLLLALLLPCSLLAQTRGEPFRCTVTVSTATTLTAVGGSCAGEAGLSMYITDITVGSTVISSTAADAMPTLKYGTGSTCGTGTTVFWLGQLLAFTTITDNRTTPIRIPPGNDMCWIHSASGTKHWVISGYKAP